MRIALITFTLLALTLCIWLRAEDEPSSPELASPISIPAGVYQSVPESNIDERCQAKPCSRGCPQMVTCNDYDAAADSCSTKSQVLVDWKCSEPCSCASDATVVCNVSYRCVDMAVEIDEIRRTPSRNAQLAKPSRRSPRPRTNIE